MVIKMLILNTINIPYLWFWRYIFEYGLKREFNCYVDVSLKIMSTQRETPPLLHLHIIILGQLRLPNISIIGFLPHMCENANVMMISAIFANTNGILVNF